MSDTAPYNIGRYEIREEMDRGGMGIIYRAYDARFDRDVALKILPTEFIADERSRALFAREAKVVATLEHPAIVPVYDFGEEANRPYFVMRLMLGGSLADRIATLRMEPREAVALLEQLAGALDHAHSKNIIHRDLKPGNILFDLQAKPYLSDFGVAKVVDQNSSVISQIMGTPTYMSPEQLRGDRMINHRSDLYMLGAVLWECLAGTPPYQADSPIQMAIQHMNVPLPSLRASRPDLPPEMDKFMMQALAKEPEQRFASASEMAMAMRDALAGYRRPLARRAPTPRQDVARPAPSDSSRTPTPRGQTPRGQPLRSQLREETVPLPARSVRTPQGETPMPSSEEVALPPTHVPTVIETPVEEPSPYAPTPPLPSSPAPLHYSPVVLDGAATAEPLPPQEIPEVFGGPSVASPTAPAGIPAPPPGYGAQPPGYQRPPTVPEPPEAQRGGAIPYSPPADVPYQPWNPPAHGTALGDAAAAPGYSVPSYAAVAQGYDMAAPPSSEQGYAPPSYAAAAQGYSATPPPNAEPSHSAPPYAAADQGYSHAAGQGYDWGAAYENIGHRYGAASAQEADAPAPSPPRYGSAPTALPKPTRSKDDSDTVARRVMAYLPVILFAVATLCIALLFIAANLP